MVSLNTSISTAEVAPSPAMRFRGLRPKTMATATMTATKKLTMRSTPQKVWKYCCADERGSVFICPTASIMLCSVRSVITVIYTAVRRLMASLARGYSPNTIGRSHHTTMAGTM